MPSMEIVDEATVEVSTMAFMVTTIAYKPTVVGHMGKKFQKVADRLLQAVMGYLSLILTPIHAGIGRNKKNMLYKHYRSTSSVHDESDRMQKCNLIQNT